METFSRRLGMLDGNISALKEPVLPGLRQPYPMRPIAAWAQQNRPHARINLVRTHSVPAMALAKNTNSEPKDVKYIKNVIADYCPRGFGFAQAL